MKFFKRADGGSAMHEGTIYAPGEAFPADDELEEQLLKTGHVLADGASSTPYTLKRIRREIEPIPVPDVVAKASPAAVKYAGDDVDMLRDLCEQAGIIVDGRWGAATLKKRLKAVS